jgi:DNA-binding transcriptional ArsR family regulator
MSQVTCCDFDDFVKAMADEMRQRILMLLREREMNVGELKDHFPVTQPTISHHLALLRRANLVTARHDGRQTFYRANPICVAECCREILTRFNISSPVKKRKRARGE